MEPGKYYFIEDKSLMVSWIVFLYEMKDEDTIMGPGIAIDSGCGSIQYFEKLAVSHIQREVREATEYEARWLANCTKKNLLISPGEIPLIVGDVVEICMPDCTPESQSFYGHYHGDIGEVVGTRDFGDRIIYQVRVEGRENLGDVEKNVTEYYRHQFFLIDKEKIQTQKDEWAILDEPEEDFSCLKDL